jgi:Ca2+/Na+ antiporter
MGNESTTPKWQWYHTAGVFIIIVAIVVLGWFLPSASRLWAWLMILILMTAFIILVGLGVTGRPAGLLIDRRNKMSLSRFQLVLWTVIILSGYLAAALCNLSETYDDPLSIALQPELWTLMGISTVSLIGSPLIKSTKESKQPDPDQEDAALQVSAADKGVQKDSTTGKRDTSGLSTRGLLVANDSIDQATLADMFGTEETGNAGHLDLGKIQMFFFTIVLALSYAVALASMFSEQPKDILELPSLSQGMIALLGISHGGYLVNKATPRSKTADQ